MANSDPWIGKQVGNYRIVEIINRGAFGSVYKGEHLYFENDPVVAIKLPRTAFHTEEERTEFIKEAQLQHQLQHPHILPILDAGFQDGIPYLVTMYAAGGSLRDRLGKRHGQPASIDEAVVILTQVGQALGYAHQRQPSVVHRDLKPENILFDEKGHVLLADFGIAVLLSSVRTGLVGSSGTPPYMAPEQFEGLASTKSDQYALGCIAYELLTGRRLFNIPNPTLEAFWYHHAKVEPVPPIHYNPLLPAHIEQAILTALSKDRTKRYSDVSAFIQALTKPPLGTTLLTYQGHNATEWVYAVAWSPDGKRIASGSGDETVQVWEAATGQTVLTHQGHTNHVEAVAWSPDGKRIASGSLDGTVQIWEVATGQTALTYQGHTNFVCAVAWSPDGKRIASSSGDGTAQVWDAATGQALVTYQGHTNHVEAVAWSPDGKRIASDSFGSGDGTVQVWEAATGKTLVTYQGHSAGVDAVAWSPDGKHIASGSSDRTVQVWEAATGKMLVTHQGHSAGVDAVAWSPDGKRIASSSFGSGDASGSFGSGDKTVQVWEAATGQMVLTYQGHSDYVLAVAWSSDGKRIASSSFEVKIWQAE